MPEKYTPEELRSASNRVMKSLNWINHKGSKPLVKPAIQNSLGRSSGKISKSSQKRRNKKERANLGGENMKNLLTSLPEIPHEMPATIKTVSELRERKLQGANNRRHHSRKAEHKVIQHEVASFNAKPLSEIRAKLMQNIKGNGDTMKD